VGQYTTQHNTKPSSLQLLSSADELLALSQPPAVDASLVEMVSFMQVSRCKTFTKRFYDKIFKRLQVLQVNENEMKV